MISKSDLKSITEASTAVDSFKATLDALSHDQTISTTVADVVKLALDGYRDALEPAILAGVSKVSESAKPAGTAGDSK